MNRNEKKTNTLAILGFIFSFLFSLVGLILSILGLNKSKETNSGKGLSIAGIIISSISIIMSILILVPYYYNYDRNSKINEDDNVANDYNFYFSCHLKNYMTEEKIADNDAYGVGDDIVCSFRSTTYNISKLSFAFADSSDNIELVDINYENNDWQIDKHLKSVSLVSLNDNSKIGDVKFIFNIVNNKNSNDNYEIKISNINFKSSNKYYKSSDKVIKLETPNYRTKTTKGKIEFYKLSSDGSYSKINEINCNCSRTAMQTFMYVDYDKGKTMLIDEDNKTWILYDMEKGTLGTYGGGNGRWLYSANDNYYIGTYIYVKDKDSDSYGIIDKNGNIIHDFNLNNACLGQMPSSMCLSYSIEGDLFVDKKDDKYGIVRISSNDVVIDYNYELIKIINSKYFKVKDGDKWYLYSFDTKNKHINDSFNDIQVLTDDILIVEKDGYWKFIDYDNNSIIKDEIKIDSKYKYISINKTNDQNIVYVGMCTDELCHEEANEYYEYNLKSNTLTKKTK